MICARLEAISTSKINKKKNTIPTENNNASTPNETINSLSSLLFFIIDTSVPESAIILANAVVPIYVLLFHDDLV